MVFIRNEIDFKYHCKALLALRAETFLRIGEKISPERYPVFVSSYYNQEIKERPYKRHYNADGDLYDEEPYEIIGQWEHDFLYWDEAFDQINNNYLDQFNNLSEMFLSQDKVVRDVAKQLHCWIPEK